MQVFEKIIDKLVNKRKTAEQLIMENPQDELDKIQTQAAEDFASAYGEAIEIVKQVAEEYSNDKINQLAMVYAKNLVQYGIDITKIWDTATQQTASLNQAYMRGIQDERNRFEQYNNGWILVSDRLPEEREDVEVTVEEIADEIGGKRHYTARSWLQDGQWVIKKNPYNPNVIAWKYPTEPYQPNVCNANDCPINDGKECPAAEGCAGYEPKGE